MFIPSLIGAFRASEPSFSDRSTFLIWTVITFAIFFIARLSIASPYFVWKDAACELEKSISDMSRKDEFIDCVLKMQTTYHYGGDSYHDHAERAFQLMAITKNPKETDSRLRNFIDIVKDDKDFQRTHIAAKDLIDWIRTNA